MRADPETLRIVRIERKGRISATEVGQPAVHQLGLVAILEVASAHALEQRRACKQHRRRSTLPSARDDVRICGSSKASYSGGAICSDVHRTPTLLDSQAA